MKKLILSLSLASFLAAPALAEEKPKKPVDLDAAFKKMDKDSDGKLTEAEFLGKREGEQAEMGKKQFARLDKNKDGSLTLEEFKARPMKPKTTS